MEAYVIIFMPIAWIPLLVRSAPHFTREARGHLSHSFSFIRKGVKRLLCEAFLFATSMLSFVRSVLTFTRGACRQFSHHFSFIKKSGQKKSAANVPAFGFPPHLVIRGSLRNSSASQTQTNAAPFSAADCDESARLTRCHSADGRQEVEIAVGKHNGGIKESVTLCNHRITYSSAAGRCAFRLRRSLTKKSNLSI